MEEIKHRLGEHDIQLNSIYDAIENLLDEKAAQRKWDERERIGFKNKQYIKLNARVTEFLLPFCKSWSNLIPGDCFQSFHIRV